MICGILFTVILVITPVACVVYLSIHNYIILRVDTGDHFKSQVEKSEDDFNLVPVEAGHAAREFL